MEGSHEGLEDSSPPTPTCGSMEWTAENHSWILVDTGSSTDVASEVAASLAADSPLLQPGRGWPATESATSSGADEAPAAAPQVGAELTNNVMESIDPETPLHTPVPSPKNLSESLLQDGETVAALAISEILSPSSPLVSRSGSHASDISPPYSPPSLWGECSGPLKPPVPGSACVLCGQEPPAKAPSAEKGAKQEAKQEDFPASALWSPLWSRPLAIVAVLVATHAATLMLGVVLGRQTAIEPKAEECLARRFSSGPYGNHARLSWS